MATGIQEMIKKLVSLRERRPGKRFGATHLTMVLLAMLPPLCACTTEAERQASENAAIQQQVVEDIDWICGLPPAKREAEIARVEKEVGMILHCGKD